jgi:PAS domain S-box-containing protein
MIKLNQNTLKDIFFTVVFLLLLAGAILSYDRIQKLIRSYNRVTHTNLIKLKIEELRVAIVEGESAQRGYLLTHDTIIFKPYKNALKKSHLLLDDIDHLTKDNPPQQQNSKDVRIQLDSRFALMDAVRRRFNINGDIGLDSLQKGKLLMDALHNSLMKMELTEDRLLTDRTNRKNEYENLSPLFILLFTLLILTTIFFAFKKIKADRLKLRKINDSLETKNEELVATKNFLQLILDSSVDFIGSMDRDLKFITANKKAGEIFKLEPDEIIGKNILELYPVLRGTDMHNDMLRALKGQTIHILQRRSAFDPERFFEMFFIPLYENTKITGIVTIVRDITALVEANENLKAKNAELERSNTELASFNYIASHDLQEPLRKIQLFSDRIREESAAELPEKAAQNFERITAAALRMRRLIEALLSYSVASRSEIEFEKIDLNKVVHDVREQIMEEDTAKNIFIDSEKLPVANVIPVQFHQLIFNLISNSVKYRKPDADLVITITGEKVSGKSIKGEFEADRNEYFKITITDNGIGFSQEYSDKIFGLFQRLHAKNEYSGTGIGLAICRKIMNNHHGFIKALGRDGAGAAFELYFPV